METMKVRAIDVWKMRRAILLHVFLLAALVTLTACGGGGGAPPAAPASSYSQPASVTSPASDSAAASDSADLDLAARLYKGDERTPAGFAVEQRPANVLGTLSTRHLKNTDLATGPQAISPVYEICTNDMAQAIDWSEKQATWQGQYSDMVEVNSDNRMIEVVRVPRADVSAMIRHRVFRCDYLDRAGSDLRADAGSAGSMNQRPLTADELKSLAEYLWQFTMFNNSDYAVLSSSSSPSAGSIVETIRMGQLVRGSSGGCDTVQVSDWTHTMNATDGTLTRGLTAVRSFKVRSSGGSAASCSG
jgi:predicted small lipoprotein YifL